MAMIAACPTCHTRFRVTLEQLDAHRGDVRCGRCAVVFNAHDCLEHEPEGPEPVLEQPVESFSPTGKESAPRKRSFSRLWLIGVLLLLAILGFQSLYFFRSELAARHPEFRPFLQQFCGVLQCGIRLPANPDLLGIETSSLETDPDQAGLVTLNAVLRSRAKTVQEYPQLELTLTDTQEQMIARRIFSPGEYAKNADLNRGMVPNEGVAVKLFLDLGDLKAAGYRVFLFYPQ